ncbi:hypothetical protein ACKXGF_01555 [Alkalibacillus sp. S2W]|uniref:hypothetical protein n=1 Tax=Alkalibacillus TaxID=331654 RepID=UPI00141F13E6|nr:hypothetical protein [Alkalibacillus almallahensis]NIK13077.1 putative negative regulator of RcsB-dependent stress response [Alkalibacillus almallahensis]
MNIKGKTIVGTMIAIVIIMAFVIYFMFSYFQEEDLIDESQHNSPETEHRLII